MNYDVVVGVGCSFMNGDRIVDKDGVVIGKDFVAPKLLSEKLKIKLFSRHPKVFLELKYLQH